MINCAVHCDGCLGDFEIKELSEDGYCESCEYALCEMLSARDDDLMEAGYCE